MNSTDSMIEDPPDIKAVLIAQSRAKRLQSYAILCLCIVLVALAVLALGQALSNRTSTRENGDRIEKLTAQLVEAQSQITKQAQADLVRTACTQRLTVNTNRAAYNAAAAEDALVIAISITPIEERQATLAETVQALRDAVSAYEAAVSLEASYTADVPAEPCPLDVTQVG